MKQLVYLAAPYSHPDERVMEERFHAINRAAARFMSQGVFIISPISHTHPIAVDGGMLTDWNFWRDYDRALMECCNEMMVLKLDGWELSEGIKAEVALALELGLKISKVDP